MTADRPKRTEGLSEDELLDEPLVRYGGADAILRLTDGDQIDLNATPDPFTGRLPVAAGMSSLRSPDHDLRETESRERVGRRLQALREDRGISKKDLAASAGVSTGQITRLERGRSELGLSLVSTIVRALGGRMTDIAVADAPELSIRELVKIGERAGAPRPILQTIAGAVTRHRFADALVRAFGWTRDALLRGAPLSAAPPIDAAFAGGAAPAPDSAVLALARTMSELSVSLHEVSFAGVPADPHTLRDEVLARSSGSTGVTLEALLSWTWDAGIVVLPLPKARDFAAAVWYVEETPVIVLKESRTFGAYWIFDLAHELAHLALGHIAQKGIVEVAEVDYRKRGGKRERAANDYAFSLLLHDADTLVADVRRRTANDAPARFKFAVQDVAQEHGVSAGVLGLVAAHEMSDVPADKDRWGSAQNLARDEDPDGRERVEAEFAARLALDALDELDAALVRAVSRSAEPPKT